MPSSGPAIAISCRLFARSLHVFVRVFVGDPRAE
jgi:hypothetical protein